MELVIAELQAALGADRVQTDPETLARRTLDTWPLRLVQKVIGAEAPGPLCVVRPRSTAELSRALAAAQRLGVAVVPYGGGSGVVGGAQAVPGGVVVDVGEMAAIIGLDEVNLTVTAQAGVLLGQLETWLGERGYTTGHYPQSIDVAQLGGLVATRSAGQFSTRYGSIEERLAGLEAVLPDGQVVRVGGTPRRSTGPDLRHLWLGSEGSFGIISEVTLNILPVPEERWMGAYAIPSMRAGLELIRQAMRAGWRPPVVRLHDEIEAARLCPGSVREGEGLLLLLSEGPVSYAVTEGAALDRIATAGGARPLGPGPVEQWLANRNDVHDFDKYIAMGIIVDTIEVAGLWRIVPDLYEQVTARLRAEVPELAVVSGHASHCYPQGANLYFTFGAVPPREPAEAERIYRSIWAKVMETTLALGGTISHHHGIGRMRSEWVPAELGSSFRLLRALKQALDPQGRMNPGALLPREAPLPPEEDGHDASV